MSKIKTYKLFLESNNFDELKSIIKPVMDDIEDEFGFDCLYHEGSVGWSYPCDLAICITLQGNIIQDSGRYWIEKALPDKSVGIEKVKQKYDLIYQRLHKNTFLDCEGIEVVGMMIYFRENQRVPVFSNRDFLNFVDFEKDVKEGQYFQNIKKSNLQPPKIEEVDCLIVLLKMNSM